MKKLVIVESPAKARTLNKYLGKGFQVKASMGHVKDLPKSKLGVDVNDDFKPTYVTIRGKEKVLRELKKAAKEAQEVYLASDPDREGEAIAWHLAEALEVMPQNANRVVFNAITKSKIENAFLHPRPINMDKVNAQQARRILDRIVGYQVSPLLWKKVAGGLSAGRVQSVAVRLIVEREREIESFIPNEYWKVMGYFTIDVDNVIPLRKAWQEWLAETTEKQDGRKSDGRKVREKNDWLIKHNSLAAELIEIDGKKFEAKHVEAVLSVVKRAGFQLDEQIETKNPKAKGPAQRVMILRGHMSGGPSWQVKSIKTKRVKSRPYAPFITSTLQQTAANQLGFPAQLTMSTAQSLYEGVSIHGIGSIGLITYMRTDSTYLSGEAINMVRQYIRSEFGDQYLPAKANSFSSSNKSAQEAHEAIRPTDVSLNPDRVQSSLNAQQYKLYKLIWERFLACQMTDAQWDSTVILISGADHGGELIFRANGRALVFDGFYKVVGVPTTSDEVMLPLVTEKQPLAAIQIDPAQNFTSPPPRYTEASLVKKLETEGIGRPSTYAQIIQVIQNRKYVEKIHNTFHATDLGKIVNDKLIEAFPEILQVGYTRYMEQQLDNVEEKHADWVQMLHDFYGPFKSSLDLAYKNMNHAKAEIEPAPYTCPQCGSNTVYRFGRNGKFLSCSKYPECKFAAPIDSNGKPISPEQTDVACPNCGSPMLLRKGRFGPFLSCAKYPDCKGILNLDKKGCIVTPKIPPLLTDLPCPKCQAPLSLRRGARGLWLSCSKFPKCSGRLGWASIKDDVKRKWMKALENHEKTYPQPIIRTIDGNPIGDAYKPQPLNVEKDETGEK